MPCINTFCKSYLCAFLTNTNKSYTIDKKKETNLGYSKYYSKSEHNLYRCVTNDYIRSFLLCETVSSCSSFGNIFMCKDGYLETYQRKTLKIEFNLFTCEDKRQVISYTLVCDHRSDCDDGSDESFCLYPALTDKTLFR